MALNGTRPIATAENAPEVDQKQPGHYSNAHGYHVARLISSRICVELVLGTAVRQLYHLQPNISLNLWLGSVCFIGLTVLGHCVSRHIWPGLLPGIFGSKWKLTWPIFRSLIVPTMCQCFGLLMKQFVVRDDGVGYAEMLMEIGVPIQCVLQYYFNGETIGRWGLVSCLTSGLCFALCLPICSSRAVMLGLMSSTVACIRCSLIVSANSQNDTSPDLNLVLQGFITLPVYSLAIVAASHNDWSELNDQIVTCLTSGTFVVYILFAWLSNLCVFRLFDVATPFTYQISSQMKGLSLTAWDLFYLDYFVVTFVVTVYQVAYVSLAKAMNLVFDDLMPVISTDWLLKLQESLLWRGTELSLLSIIAFVLKMASSIAYLLEKKTAQKKELDQVFSSHGSTSHESDNENI